MNTLLKNVLFVIMSIVVSLVVYSYAGGYDEATSKANTTSDSVIKFVNQ